MYVCMHVCMYFVCMRMYMYKYVWVCDSTYIYTSVYIYICMYGYVYMHMHMSICVRIRVHACMFVGLSFTYSLHVPLTGKMTNLVTGLHTVM